MDALNAKPAGGQPSLRSHDETDVWIVFEKVDWCWKVTSIWFTLTAAKKDARRVGRPTQIVCVPVPGLLEAAIAALKPIEPKKVRSHKIASRKGRRHA